MLATTVYTLVSQHRVLPKYRNALVLSSMVTFIAGYHYLRIFDSFKHATAEGTFNVAHDVNTSSTAFNEAYRYVDWILTVPLLLVEVIAVLALAKEASKSLITRLVPASAAMIALGYPGETPTSFQSSMQMEQQALVHSLDVKLVTPSLTLSRSAYGV